MLFSVVRVNTWTSSIQVEREKMGQEKSHLAKKLKDKFLNEIHKNS